MIVKGASSTSGFSAKANKPAKNPMLLTRAKNMQSREVGSLSHLLLKMISAPLKLMCAMEPVGCGGVSSGAFASGTSKLELGGATPLSVQVCSGLFCMASSGVSASVLVSMAVFV